MEQTREKLIREAYERARPRWDPNLHPTYEFVLPCGPPQAPFGVDIEPAAQPLTEVFTVSAEISADRRQWQAVLVSGPERLVLEEGRIALENSMLAAFRRHLPWPPVR